MRHSRGTRTALLTAAVASVLVIHEQSAAQEALIEEVVVTGTRIARPEIEVSSPIQALDAGALATAGAANVADVLAELPSVGTAGYARTSTNFSSFGNGVSTVNLRNLGDQRTLVLVNGRRLAAGVAGSSAVDLNNIPVSLIDSVQVLTGGASAVYGSEAVAGVVNFVLQDDFEGFAARAQSGLTSGGGRAQHMAAFTAGQPLWDRGGVVLNVQYDKDEGLRSKERALSAHDDPMGSAYLPQGLFFGDGTSDWTYDANNVLQQGFDQQTEGFNRNAERYIAVPVERVLYSLLAHYDLTDGLELFVEGSYADVDTRTRLEAAATDNSDAVLPDGSVSRGLTLDNPFIPAAIRADMLAAGADTLTVIKRMNGVFDRSNDTERDYYRYVVGVRGALLERWDWDAYVAASRTKDHTTTGTALRDRYYYALDAIAGPNGEPMCRDAAARANGCAPFNPFGFNSVSPEAARYVTNSGQLDTYDSRIHQRIAAANIKGAAAQLPAGELMLAAGAERRWEESREVFSAETQAGNTLGNAFANTTGAYHVSEAYVEATAPIVRDLPAMQSVDLEAALRLGDYSTVGEVLSWRGGLVWAPVEDVRLRTSYSQATRAPNIKELFQGPNVGYPSGVNDPCDGVTAVSAGAVDDYCRSLPGVAEQIAQEGVFSYQLRDLQSIEGETRGNPNVEEEIGRTLSVGVVLTPRALPAFSLSLDWFDIRIEDAITVIPRQFALDQCALSAGRSSYCELIVREGADPVRPRTPGTVFHLDSYYINAAAIETRGLDVAMSHAWELPAGRRIGATLAYTYLDKLTLQPLTGAPVQDNKGQLDGSGRLGAGFEHRANLDLRYAVGGFAAAWRVNYLSAMQDTLAENDPTLSPDQNDVGSFVYHDVQLRYAFDAQSRYEAYLGVDNVFDKRPPRINQFGASHVLGTETAAASYDPVGRFLYGGVQVRF